MIYRLNTLDYIQEIQQRIQRLAVKICLHPCVSKKLSTYNINNEFYLIILIFKWFGRSSSDSASKKV